MACSVLLLMYFHSAAATDFALPVGLRLCGNGRVDTVLSGDSFTLHNGTTVAMASIKAPEYWPAGAPYRSWPYGHRAKEILTTLLSGKTVDLYCGRKSQNHQNQTLAYILTQDHKWAQQLMVDRGAAYVFPLQPSGSFEDELWGTEAVALANRKGLWNLGAMRPVDAISDKLRPGWFQIVKGTVRSSKASKNSVYLNFAEDWSKDFTVEIPNNIARQYNEDLMPLLELAGQNVEVRGWVEWAGGPKIILENASLLRIFPGPTPNDSSEQ